MPIGAFRLNAISAALSSAPSVPTRTPKSVKIWDTDGKLQPVAFGKINKSINFSGGLLQTGFLEIPMSSEFYWHTQSYTMEAWVYPRAWTGDPSTTNVNVMGNMGYDGWGYYNFGFSNSGKITFHYYYNNNTGLTAVVQEATASGVLNQWQHIAMTHSAGTITLYVNGVAKVSAAVTGTPGYNFGNVRGFQIGCYYYPFNGYMDEIRVSNTVRYTGTFTPSTTQFTNDANTILLIHGEDTTPYVTGTVCVSDDGGTENITPSGYYGYSFSDGETNASAINPKQISVVGYSTGNKVRGVYIRQQGAGFENWLTPIVWDPATDTFTKGSQVQTTTATANAFWGRKAVSQGEHAIGTVNATSYGMSYVPTDSGNVVSPFSVDSTGALTLGTSVSTGISGVGTVAEHGDIDYNGTNTNGLPSFVWFGRVGTGDTFSTYTSSGNALTRISGGSPIGVSNRATVVGSNLSVGQGSALQIASNTSTALATTIGTTTTASSASTSVGLSGYKHHAMLLSTSGNVSKYIVYGVDSTGNTSYQARIITVAYTNNSAPVVTYYPLSTESMVSSRTITEYGYRIVRGWDADTVILFYSDNNDTLYSKYGIINSFNNIVWGSETNLGPVSTAGKLASFDIMPAYIDSTHKYFLGITSTSASENVIGNISHFALDASAVTLPTVAYSVSTSATSVNEGSNITFTVNTAGVSDATTLYWTLDTSNTFTSADISGSVISGSFNTTNSTYSLTKTILADSLVDGAESFWMSVRTGSTSGTVVARTPNIAIMDTSVPAPTSFTFVGSATSLAGTITIPAAAQAGDIAVLFDHQLNATDLTPTGFTQITTNTLSTFRSNASYKLLVAGDPGATITGMNNATPRKVMVVFRPNNPITTITPTLIGSQATSAAPTNQTLTGGTAPCLYFASYAKSTATVPTRGWTVGTPTELSSVSSNGVYVKYLVYNTAPSATTISMTDAGTNGLISFRINVT
jgi:hypothetical protein